MPEKTEWQRPTRVYTLYFDKDMGKQAFQYAMTTKGEYINSYPKFKSQILLASIFTSQVVCLMCIDTYVTECILQHCLLAKDWE